MVDRCRLWLIGFLDRVILKLCKDSDRFCDFEDPSCDNWKEKPNVESENG